MDNFDLYDTNPRYRNLIERGFFIDATTARANCGTLILLFRDEVLATVEIKTNGRGTKEILRALPTAKRRTHLDEGLKALHESAKFIVAEDLTPNGRYKNKFVASYQAAVTTHADKGCDKVFDHLEKKPTAKLSKLYKVFTDEILANVEGGRI